MSKYKSAIEKITLNAATFSGETVEPSYINFFFGNNGTGKSTIASAIDSQNGLTWGQNSSAERYEILVYNRDFAEMNISNLSYIPGVFSMGEKNIQIAEEIDKKKKESEMLQTQIFDNIAQKEGIEYGQNMARTAFQKEVYAKCRSWREQIKGALTGSIASAIKFTDKVTEATPNNSAFEELKALYDSAFDPNAQSYPEFADLDLTEITRITECELLEKSIISSNSSPFSQFIKSLEATDWVKQGYDKFPHNHGDKCPYCQQKLNDKIIKQIADCFDGEYQQSLDMLRRFYADYKGHMGGDGGAGGFMTSAKGEECMRAVNWLLELNKNIKL
jgi:wobble nucleotide-excising tRNase